MPANILVVDDESDLRELLSFNLERHGFTVRTADSAAAALAAIKQSRPDLILLDVMLPDIPGTRLTGQLKNSADTASIPIILLTARTSETDVIVGLNVGADDYVTKPVSTAILAARIEALLRRFAASAPVADDTIVSGPITIVPNKYQVLVDAKSVGLTLAEFKILYALIRANGAVLSRAKLMEEFGSDPEVTDRTIDVHIAALRKKLGPARNCVKTLHRLGYRFEQ
jgi:two-component system phosphate regulon response regulator PhoB